MIDDVKNLLSGLLKPDISEKITGNVEIREVFNISKIGNIAGCMVKDPDSPATTFELLNASKILVFPWST